MIHPNFRLIAAPFTPMNADGSLNLSRVAGYARHLVENGVRGAFVGGTSGEGQSLTVEERLALAEAWAKNDHRAELEIVVHVGHNAQADAVRLAAQAHALGANAIAMHAPTWFSGLSVAELVEFCVPVAAAAKSLPFYLYDIPKITGVHVSSANFLAQAKSRIPTLAGLKYTNPDCVTVQECIQADGQRYDILWGTDEALLAGVALGASGAVGSTYSFAAPIYQKMLAAVRLGDWQAARAEQARSIAMIRTFQKYSVLAAFKYATTLVGVDCGPARLPVGNLSEEEKRALRSELMEGQYLHLAN